MRHFGLTVFLCLIAQWGAAFELEESRIYPSADETSEIAILSTADVGVFEPIVLAFQKRHPGVSIRYDVASSTEVMKALYTEGAAYDLAISSAMDLQTKLANDGFAQDYTSDIVRGLPDWATWRNQVFAFTQEPAVLVYSKEAFQGRALPTNREELIDLLRESPEVFQGRIGTYDVRTSGLGYLFATQDSRNTSSFWRLIEVMGRLEAQLYCCSGAMIDDVAEGRLALAYNVLGSYANSQLADRPGIGIVEMEDFVSIMLRTALIPKNAASPATAGLMIDFLAELPKHPELVQQTGLPPVKALGRDDSASIRPIRLGPGLLVFLDRMRRVNFLRSWAGSVIQN